LDRNISVLFESKEKKIEVPCLSGYKHYKPRSVRTLTPANVTCVASVSVGLSVGLKHFSLFERAKLGASAKKCEKAKNASNGRKKPYGNACYAGYCKCVFLRVSHKLNFVYQISNRLCKLDRVYKALHITKNTQNNRQKAFPAKHFIQINNIFTSGSKKLSDFLRACTHACNFCRHFRTVQWRPADQTEWSTFAKKL